MGFEEGGSRAVMASYNAWNGTPMTVNPVLKDVVIESGATTASSAPTAARSPCWLPVTCVSRQGTRCRGGVKAGINRFLDTYTTT